MRSIKHYNFDKDTNKDTNIGKRWFEGEEDDLEYCLINETICDRIVLFGHRRNSLFLIQNRSKNKKVSTTRKN